MRTHARPFRFGIQLRPQRTTWDRYRGRCNWSRSWASTRSGTRTTRSLPRPDDGARFETLTTLGAMADGTSKVRIGALTFGNLYRDPVTLAKSATMVDHISSGRLEFALGAAWRRSSEHMGSHTQICRNATRLGWTSRCRSSNRFGLKHALIGGPPLPGGQRSLRAEAAAVASPTHNRRRRRRQSTPYRG